MAAPCFLENKWCRGVLYPRLFLCITEAYQNVTYPFCEHHFASLIRVHRAVPELIGTNGIHAVIEPVRKYEGQELQFKN